LSRTTNGENEREWLGKNEKKVRRWVVKRKILRSRPRRFGFVQRVDGCEYAQLGLAYDDGRCGQGEFGGAGVRPTIFRGKHS
jgi:hypothetical protein